MEFLKLKKNKIKTENELFVVKDNYVEVISDFKIKDLKPYQRLIIVKYRDVDKKYLIDFALVKSEINRLKSKDIISRSYELKTDKPFRMISQNDIDLGNGKNSHEISISANEESTILDSLSNVNPFDNNKKNTIDNMSTNFSILNDKKYNKNEEGFLSFRKKKDKNSKPINTKFSINKTLNNVQLDTTNDVEREIESEEENFDVIPNYDAINLAMKNKYRKNLIFDDNDPIEIYDDEKRTVILPFKLREVNDEWKKNDPSFFRATPKGANKWFTNYIEESFLKSLEDSYNGSLSSPFDETYEPLSIVDFGPDDLIDQNVISSTDNDHFIKYSTDFNDNHQEMNDFNTKNTVGDAKILPSNNVDLGSRNIKYFDVYENIDDHIDTTNSNDDQHDLNHILNSEIEVNFDSNMLESSSTHSDNYSDDVNYDETSFFKREPNSLIVHEIVDSNIKPNKKIYGKFGKVLKDSKYEKIKLPKLNNMIIVRKKIDKKLIKARTQI